MLLTDHHLEFLSLKGDCTGLCESTLIEIPQCWKSRDAAKLSRIILTFPQNLNYLHSQMLFWNCPYRGGGGGGADLVPTWKITNCYMFPKKFWLSDVLPGNTEVKQGKLVESISLAKVYFRETYKSQRIIPISPTPKFTLGFIQIKVKSLSTSFQCLVQ